MLDVLGQLSGQVAHDFNNVLAVAVTTLEIIGTLVDEPEAQRILATAMNSLQRGRRLTDHLAAVSAARFEAALVDIHDLIAALQGTLIERLGRDCTLQVRLDAEQRVTRTHATLLAAALLNLADNAREAMPRGGVWTLSTRNENRRAPNEACERIHLLISAQDTGIGMSQEVQEHAFDLFFSTKATTSDEPRGIGLTQVRDIARRAGGFVAMDTAPGRGTTIRLAFPVATPS
jgi:signal transduction histidine kinase